MSSRERRDIRGRKVGHNWWREYNNDLLLYATLIWEQRCEEVALGYDTEIAEYAEQHPRPNLKAFLLANKGIGTRPEER